MKMVPLNVKLVLVVFCSACSGVLVKDFESEWERGESNDEGFSSKPWFLGRSAEPSAEKAMELPEFLTIPVSSDHKEDLKPEIGVRQIPRWLQKVLLGIPPTIPQAAAGADESDVIGVHCYLDRLHVRVRKEIFRSEDAHKYLTLGSCPVNQGHEEYYYLLYSLKSDCGFKIESSPDYLSIRISLLYKPAGPVLREMPFNIRLQCKYPRLFYSYKVGFHPKVQGGTVYKKLQANSSFTICPQDASGALITSSKIYNLGDVMHFEASVRDKTESREKRTYINKCFVTTSPDPYSHPRYTLIDNQGCMVDGKVVTQSKFLSGDSKMIQKFSVGAFIFRQGVPSTSPQQFFMHCEVSAGPLTPTPSAKACSYDQASQQWKELYGNDCVCACCESACPSADRPEESENIVSTRSWKVASSTDGYEEDEHLLKSADSEAEMKKHTDFSSMLNCDYA
uniref:Zona pellucida glycoprotein 3c n=2 Tax=Nothobranchius korthausae TaxID=1143690 RepID=A0A1A8F2W6_9TELE